MMRSRSILALAALAAASPLQAQDSLAQRTATLERRLPALMDSAGVPGLTIAVIQNGRLAYARAFGVKSAAAPGPVDTATVFEAASLTKQIVAYTAMRLVERGLLDLDRPLYQYLPYPDIADDARYQKITTRMVLSHSSGFPNWRPDGGKLTILFEPGSRFQYSGEGMVYLGKVLETLTGLNLAELARREVFVPLHMTRSSLVWDPRFESNVALPHGSDGVPGTKGHPAEANAAASLQTTGPDYGRFMAELLNPTGLKPATVAAMVVPQVRVDSAVSWGLGVGLQRTDRGTEFFQWGDIRGYKGFLLGNPARKSGLVYFANSDNGLGLQQAILALLVGGSEPAVTWLKYEQYDAPSRLVRQEVEDVVRRQGSAAGIARYRELRLSRPPEAFNEFVLNQVGYDLMRSQHLKDAIAIFELNVAEYPNASNPYDSMGEAYLADGQLEASLRSYQRSVALDSANTNAVQVMQRIRERMAGGQH